MISQPHLLDYLALVRARQSVLYFICSQLQQLIV